MCAYAGSVPKPRSGATAVVNSTTGAAECPRSCVRSVARVDARYAPSVTHGTHPRTQPTHSHVFGRNYHVDSIIHVCSGGVAGPAATCNKQRESPVYRVAPEGPASLRMRSAPSKRALARARSGCAAAIS